MEQGLVAKINDSKFNRLQKMVGLSKLQCQQIAIKELRICTKTVKKWKNKMQFIEKIGDVKIDRALKQMLFTQKCQIECFEFLVKDFNYFATFQQVKKQVKITRYLYNVVKSYIRQQLTRMK